MSIWLHESFVKNAIIMIHDILIIVISEMLVLGDDDDVICDGDMRDGDMCVVSVGDGVALVEE